MLMIVLYNKEKWGDPMIHIYALWSLSPLLESNRLFVDLLSVGVVQQHISLRSAQNSGKVLEKADFTCRESFSDTFVELGMFVFELPVILSLDGLDSLRPSSEWQQKATNVRDAVSHRLSTAEMSVYNTNHVIYRHHLFYSYSTEGFLSLEKSSTETPHQQLLNSRYSVIISSRMDCRRWPGRYGTVPGKYSKIPRKGREDPGRYGTVPGTDYEMLGKYSTVPCTGSEMPGKYLEMPYTTDLPYRPVQDTRVHSPQLMQNSASWQAAAPMHPHPGRNIQKTEDEMWERRTEKKTKNVKKGDRKPKATAPSANKVKSQKDMKDPVRKRRKGPSETPMDWRSPGKSGKHRRREEFSELSQDPDSVYERWEPSYHRHNRERDLTYPPWAQFVEAKEATGQNPGRRWGQSQKLPPSGLDGRKKEKLQNQRPRNGKEFPQGWSEHAEICNELEGLPSYEMCMMMKSESDLGMSDILKENEKKIPPKWVLPPPYIPPPAYEAPHRVLKVKKTLVDKSAQKPSKGGKLGKASLYERTAVRSRLQWEESNRSKKSEDQEYVECFKPNQNKPCRAMKDITEECVHGFVETKREGTTAGTEKKIKFDPKTYRNVMSGWKFPQGFSTWSKFLKHQEPDEGISQRKNVPPQSQMQEDAENIYETVEWERPPSKSKNSLEEKLKKANLMKNHVRMGKKPGQTTLTGIQAESQHLVSPSKAALKNYMPSKTGGLGAEQRIKEKKISSINKIPNTSHLQNQDVIKEDKTKEKPSSPFVDKSYKVYQDKLPYRWGFSYTANPMDKKTVFKNVDRQKHYVGEMPKWTSHLKAHHANGSRLQDQTFYKSSDDIFQHASHTLPRQSNPQHLSNTEMKWSSWDRKRSGLEKENLFPSETNMIRAGREHEISIYAQTLGLPKWKELRATNSLPIRDSRWQHGLQQDVQKSSGKPKIQESEISNIPQVSAGQHYELVQKPEKTPQASSMENDGMFIIDATCVIVRAEYIFPPSKQRVKYLHPETSKEYKAKENQEFSLESSQKQNEQIYDRLPLRSPWQELILRNQQSHRVNKLPRGNSSESVSGIPRKSHAHKLQMFHHPSPKNLEKSTRILGLSLTDSNPLETGQDSNATSTASLHQNSNDSTQRQENEESLQTMKGSIVPRGLADVWSQVTKTEDDLQLKDPMTCNASKKDLNNQVAPTKYSICLGIVYKPSLDVNDQQGEGCRCPELNATERKSNTTVNIPSANQWSMRSPISVDSTLPAVGKPNLNVWETIQSQSNLQKYNIDTVNESNLLKENIMNPAVVEEVNSYSSTSNSHLPFQELGYIKTEPSQHIRNIEAKKELNFAIDGKTSCPYLVHEVADRLIMNEALYTKTVLPVEKTFDYAKDQSLDKDKITEPFEASELADGVPKRVGALLVPSPEKVYSQLELLQDSKTSGTDTKSSLYSDGKFSHDQTLGSHIKMLSRCPGDNDLDHVSLQSRVSQEASNETNWRLNFSNCKPNHERTPLKHYTKKRGLYAKDLQEAVSRIRRHTAPDSDTDEDEETDSSSMIENASGDDGTGREGQVEAVTVSSSSDGYDSDVTVIICSESKDVNREHAPGQVIQCTSPDTIERLRDSEEPFHRRPQNSSDSDWLVLVKPPVEWEQPTQDSPYLRKLSIRSDLNIHTQTGNGGERADLSSCIEQVLEELTQAEIELFGIHQKEECATVLENET
uniref:Uncharacterized protein LOC117357251 n=1 Tax=Geotrypetes seraphini TaxID=260995 RepID=A0A6P8R0M6_GEOSA|nr:uncharacterized protein LOC117357251 [Geotrypetes seraphini]